MNVMCIETDESKLTEAIALLHVYSDRLPPSVVAKLNAALSKSPCCPALFDEALGTNLEYDRGYTDGVTWASGKLESK